jgi:protein-arginine deiminase
MALGELTITHVDGGGAEVRSHTVMLRSAPLILSHHLQATDNVYAVDDDGWNDDLVDTLSAELGERYVDRKSSRFDYDPWVQDELEIGTLTAPGLRMDVVIDSIREQNGSYLDDYPEDVLEEPDVAVETWGSGSATSQDSFGNLEVSPPVTVDGVDYPFGRVYWGEYNGRGVVPDLADMLREQKVQAPFTLDVDWLCVGHVDEYMTWLPDSSSSKGFRYIISDVDEAYAFLESLDPSMELPKYGRSHDYDTVGDILEDNALRMYNEDIQRDWIDPGVEVFKAELGIVDEDIIKIPGIFEIAPFCGDDAAALIPGTANMLVSTDIDGVTKLFMPDPFLRSASMDRSSDPFIAHIEALLPSELEPHWVDDWELYHMGLGEVHCGTNTKREPTGGWWTSAMHLINGDN